MGTAPPPEVDQAPVTETATSPDMSQYVSKEEYNELQNNYNRAEGRSKSSQKLLSLAQQMGYSDADSFADAIPGLMSSQEQRQAPQTFQGQYPDMSEEEQRPTHREGASLEDIDNRITERLGYQQAMNTHTSGRDAESQLLTAMIGAEGAFGGVFDGIDKGEYSTIFDAAYSGSGSAASEIVASAIDNMMYGMTEKYGDNTPENLQGRSMPINNPEVMNKVRDRVVEGLKELAAMSVFAASKKGLETAPSPQMEVAEGSVFTEEQMKDEREEKLSNFANSRFDDLMGGGSPSSK
jgi:hypothetical protein